MTREEAIAYFKRHIDLYCVTGICREAEEIAIKALEQDPTTKNDLAVDCISREDVLKLIYDYKENNFENHEKYPINYGTLLDMIRWVRKLPSVTPPQEPFKPMVEIDLDYVIRQKYIEREILDKIRAEIEQLRLHKAEFLTNDNKVCIDSQAVLDIIDKYKTEVEPQESEEQTEGK